MRELYVEPDAGRPGRRSDRPHRRELSTVPRVRDPLVSYPEEHVGLATIDRPERRNALNAELCDEPARAPRGVARPAGSRASRARASRSVPAPTSSGAREDTGGLEHGGGDTFRPAFERVLDAIVDHPGTRDRRGQRRGTRRGDAARGRVRSPSRRARPRRSGSRRRSSACCSSAPNIRRLAVLVGQGAARDILLTGRAIDRRRGCAKVGFVQRTSRRRPRRRASSSPAEIAALAPLSVQGHKHALNLVADATALDACGHRRDPRARGGCVRERRSPGGSGGVRAEATAEVRGPLARGAGRSRRRQRAVRSGATAIAGIDRDAWPAAGTGANVASRPPRSAPTRRRRSPTLESSTDVDHDRGDDDDRDDRRRERRRVAQKARRARRRRRRSTSRRRRRSVRRHLEGQQDGIETIALDTGRCPVLDHAPARNVHRRRSRRAVWDVVRDAVACVDRAATAHGVRGAAPARFADQRREHRGALTVERWTFHDLPRDGSDVSASRCVLRVQSDDPRERSGATGTVHAREPSLVPQLGPTCSRARAVRGRAATSLGDLARALSSSRVAAVRGGSRRRTARTANAARP